IGHRASKISEPLPSPPFHDERLSIFSFHDSSMKHALRSLLRSPGFTAVALLTLTLGIGVNTAMFTIVNTLLFQPAPYPDSEQLVRVHRTNAQGDAWPHSLPDLRDLDTQGRTFVSVTPYQWWTFSLAEPS